jgi:hypothetical protein
VAKENSKLKIIAPFKMLVFVKKAHLIKKSGSDLNFHLEMANLV